MAATTTLKATSVLLVTLIPPTSIQATNAASFTMAGISTMATISSIASMSSTSAAMAPTALPDLDGPGASKPACGSKTKKVDYDLTVHVIGLFLVILFSCLGAGFPVLAKKVKWLRIPPSVFFFCKHFGTGVLIATAFVHLLPTAFESLTDPCLPALFTDLYPAMAGVIGLFSLFTFFAIELWMHNKMPHAHSHGSATGEEFAGNVHAPSIVQPTKPVNDIAKRDTLHQQSDEPRASHVITPNRTLDNGEGSSQEMIHTSGNEWGTEFDEIVGSRHDEAQDWFSSVHKQKEGEGNSALQTGEKITPSNSSTSSSSGDPEKQLSQVEAITAEEAALSSHGLLDLDPDTVDPMVFKRMSMEITLLEGGILFHSVFVGMTVSITTEGFITLLIAILFHQTFEGLGLGSRIAAVPYPKGSITPWVLVIAFGTTAPIGQAIGLIAHKSYDPNSALALILVGTFNAISTGLLIYAALIDLLHQDFLSEEADRLLTYRKKILAFGYVLLGALGMSIVGIWA